MVLVSMCYAGTHYHLILTDMLLTFKKQLDVQQQVTTIGCHEIPAYRCSTIAECRHIPKFHVLRYISAYQLQQVLLFI